MSLPLITACGSDNSSQKGEKSSVFQSKSDKVKEVLSGEDVVKHDNSIVIYKRVSSDVEIKEIVDFEKKDGYYTFDKPSPCLRYEVGTQGLVTTATLETDNIIILAMPL